MRVGDFDREALEELFIDRVEELLHLRQVGDGLHLRSRWPCGNDRGFAESHRG